VNRAELIDILTAVQVVDHRTVGEGDILMWGAILGDLSKDDALQAVIAHRREEPGVWLEPGHIHKRVRAIRQDEFDRARDRYKYEAMCDAKAMGEIVAEVTRRNPDTRLTLPGKTIHDDTPRRQFLRPVVNPLSVPCPTCRAPTAWRCTRSGRSPGYHRTRIDAAAHASTEAEQ
jgi:hypothetical protein